MNYKVFILNVLVLILNLIHFFVKFHAFLYKYKSNFQFFEKPLLQEATQMLFHNTKNKN